MSEKFSNLFKKVGLSLDRLRNFLLVADAGSIAKAAPDDATRQSQISRQIRELEEFFGAELTQRRGKTLSLSDEGRRLATLIHGHLRDLEEFHERQTGIPQAFTIGAGSSTLEWLVTPALPEMARLLGSAILRTETHRSAALVNAVRDGRVDFAVLRNDALPPGAPQRKIVNVTFELCVPRKLVKRGAAEAALRDPEQWKTLPFAAGRDSGQTDAAVRAAMRESGVDFRPRFECVSLLQVRQLVALGHCAAVLPNLGTHGLAASGVLVVPFKPLATYGRSLVLHWNERQMRRRDVSREQLVQIAACLRAGA